ncbi:hypothetical protein TD95_000444 [Thielaviopsis punctulata]|uniref:Uncharacterized protein n=1 Tax=Thielaviopsis punctulata TaxID=72032 RepID=A0A0F4ZH45_9PEZI|nr:hypothetical protein TD95_000444 [Thielaviopsis punctulata]
MLTGEIGGCGKLSLLFKQYYQPNDFIVFMHDISQDDEFSDMLLATFPQIAQDFQDKGGKYIWVVFNKQDLLTDPSTRTERLVAWTEKFTSAAQRFPEMHICVADVLGFSARHGIHTHALLSQIYGVLRDDPEWGHRKPRETVSNKMVEPSVEELQRQAEDGARAAERTNMDVFWKEVEEGTVQWDHAAHLRVGFALVVRAGVEGKMEDVTQTFIEKLGVLKAAQPDVFRNTAHVTMTWFWIRQIHDILTAYARAHGLPLAQENFVTQTSFWIHLFTTALRELDAGTCTVLRPAVAYNGALQDMPFARFQGVFGVTGDEWREFYTVAAWTDEVGREMEKVPKRAKSWENLERKRPQGLIIREFGSMSSGVVVYEATEAEVGFYAAVVVWEAARTAAGGEDKERVCMQNEKPKTKGELLSFIFDRIGTTSTKNLAHAVLETFGSLVTGMTQAHFWVEQVAAARSEKASWLSFTDYIYSHAKLAWDDLPWLFYSPQRWKSKEGEGAKLEYDRRGV